MSHLERELCSEHEKLENTRSPACMFLSLLANVRHTRKGSDYRHGTGSADSVTSAPTHEDGAYGDVIMDGDVIISILRDLVPLRKRIII